VHTLKRIGSTAVTVSVGTPHRAVYLGMLVKPGGKHVECKHANVCGFFCLQVRHHIKGWDLEVAHEFGRPSPVVGLAKHFKYSTLRATYDTAGREAGLQYQRRCGWRGGWWDQSQQCCWPAECHIFAVF
jgi:hypothetical protein